MSDAHTRIAERLRQSRAARQATLVAAAPTLPTAATRTGAPFLTGERVFDVISGLDGQVQTTRRASSAHDAAISVQLEDGSIVWRAAEQLIGRPTAPSAEYRP